MKAFVVLAAILQALLTEQCWAQGTFRNLDFGLSQVPTSTVPNTSVDASIAFPFWTLSGGPIQISSVLYNGMTLGSLSVDLLSPDDPGGNGGIPGDYTAVLQAGFPGSFASIAQTAQIPSGVMSLLFLATPPKLAGWEITIGGRNIPVVEVTAGSRFNEYGANISAFAGMTEELRFTQLFTSGIGGSMWLGQIQFSPVAVPEPCSVGLVSLGALFASRRKLW
jgi:hypothetical protein